MSRSADELLLLYGGQIVPQSFNGGFIAMSYAVSLIGAACTLELLNRRTSYKGIFNHLLLVGSAVSMGGISIWCMHFIGNRAIDLGRGESELQIAYSSSFTALSFFMPIVVLLAAFMAIGINNTVSWWRVTIGGILAGAAICGMHYLGNNSIENYRCVYKLINVAGSAIIAVVASIVSLALFFIFRAAWTNTWWKRVACSVVLAGAVSGMHWCAATGTEYQLVSLSSSNDDLSRNTTVIVVICLSILACFIMAGSAIYTARVMRRYAHKAQQVILASAVFDKEGRILVSPDGLLPSEKITDSFIEKNASDTFSISHPLFHWMFRASRNWSSISSLMGGMANHLAHLPRRTQDGRTAIKLIDEHGDMVSDYDVILRELFCVAALRLAEKTKEQLSSVGTLWDDILPTGQGGERDVAKKENLSDLAEKGLQRGKQSNYGRGSLMFLVRRAQSERDVARLEAAGYRFAELRQVSGIIGSTMQIKCTDLESQLQTMASYADNVNKLEPGVHLGLFGIRARVGSYGFDVLVRKGARNLLPSVPLAADRVDNWQSELLQQLDGMAVSSLSRRLDALSRLSNRETTFISQLRSSLEVLRSWVGDSIFDEATLSSTVVQLPSLQTPPDSAGSSSQPVPSLVSRTCKPSSMIVLRLVVPIHVSVTSSNCEFVPLNFFKIHQLVGHDSVHQLAFTQSVHREFGVFAQATAYGPESRVSLSSPKKTSSSFHDISRRIVRSKATLAVDGEGRPIPTVFRRSSSSANSNDTGSTLKLWPKGCQSDNRSSGSASETAIRSPPPAYTSQDGAQQRAAFGGIMVSEEIRVEVHEAGDVAAPAQQPSKSQSRLPGILGRSKKSHNEKRAEEPRQHSSAAAAGPGATRPIELTLVTGGRDNTQSGARAGGSDEGINRTQDSPTFVDDLFAICIGGR